MKKGKGKGKGKDDWEETEKVAVDFAQPVADAGEEGGEMDEPVNDFMAQIMSASKKKGRKKRKDEDFEAAFADPVEEEKEEEKEKEPKGKKGKNANKKAEPEPSPEPEQEPEEATAKGKKGKKGKKDKEEEFWNDIEKIQQGELPVEEEKSAAALKRKAKKEQELEKSKQPAPEPAKPKQAAPEPVKPKEAPKQPEKAGAAAAAAAKKKSPASAIKAALAKQMEEQEKIRKAEEEARKKWEEEEAQRLEELRKEEEAKQRKKEKERQKKEELKKQGKYLTKSEKAKLAQAEERRARLEQSGAIIVGVGDHSEKPKKIVYGNKKKPRPQKDQKGDTQAAHGEEEEEEESQPNQATDKPASAPTPTPAPAPVADTWESWEEITEEKILSAQQSQDKTSEAPQSKEVSVDDVEEEDDVDEGEESEEGDSDEEDEAKEQADHSKGGKDADESEEDSEEDSEDEDDSDDESGDEKEYKRSKKSEEKKKQEAKERRIKRYEEAKSQRSKDNLRSPICVILGHVDTGKTKLLDKIRQTNVQGNEAGGITQQIGATYFPSETIQEKIAPLNLQNFDIKVPGLLVIDTPGHESFTNLRSRGSSLCNIAILVIDIMHYLEPQTIESIELLRQRKTPFIVALNKIDRIYGWVPHPNLGFQESFEKQTDFVKREFEDRLGKTKLALAERGLNSEVYFKNQDFRNYVSICPTSAITGEGIPDMIMLLIQLTQKHMGEQLMYLSELEATVLEVKVIEGQGTTIDVILSNGVLREGDRIVLCGMNGPIATNVRALLTPQPLRELRVKSQYVMNKEVKAALGVKISAPGLEKAIAGSRLMVVGPEDDEDEVKEEIMSDLADLFKAIDKSGRGVSVQASTLGSLEALLAFLKQSKIPVFNINIGPVHKKDVTRASIMLEHQREFATMLCFDVEVDKDAQKMADDLGVRIFTANIIYHLFDQFTAYMNDIQERRKKDLAPAAVFPCVLKIVPGCVFNKRNPILIGVSVVEGNLRLGTPLCVPSKEFVMIGRVTGIEINHKSIELAKKGQDVAIKVELPNYETPKMIGRHFEPTDDIVSQISRESIDILKANFREEVSKEEWALIVKLKKVFKIA